jgi:DNA-binding ferritin-like protein
LEHHRPTIGLHTLLETHYKKVDEAIDVVAERIRALDAVAPGSLPPSPKYHIKDAPATTAGKSHS